ncbi:hypothetical protein LPJ73_004240, partial [Coemansia sp. RSA 2703]
MVVGPATTSASASASASVGDSAGSSYVHRHEAHGGRLSPAAASMVRWSGSKGHQYQQMYAESGREAGESHSGSAPYGYHYQRPVNAQSYDYSGVSGSVQMEREREHEHEHEHEPERRHRSSLAMISGRIGSGSDEAVHSKSRSSMSSSALHNLLAPSSPQTPGMEQHDAVSPVQQARSGDRMGMSSA